MSSFIIIQTFLKKKHYFHSYFDIMSTKFRKCNSILPQRGWTRYLIIENNVLVMDVTQAP
jgi:hypothetical protein